MLHHVLKRRTRKIWLSVLSLTLTLAVSLIAMPPVAYAEAQTYSLQEQIVMETIGVDNLSDVDYQLVEVISDDVLQAQSSVTPYSVSSEKETELAVRIDEQLSNGTVRTEFYVPYIVTENGLENTFALAASGIVSGTYPAAYLDFTFTIIGYAGRFVQQPESSFYCYKPYYTHALWKNSKNNGTITNMAPTISTFAVKHYYNNATQTMGAALPGNIPDSLPELTRETKSTPYSYPLSNNYYSSGSLYNADFEYAFDFESGFQCFYAGCQFSYRLSNGTVGSDNVRFPFVGRI